MIDRQLEVFVVIAVPSGLTGLSSVVCLCTMPASWLCLPCHTATCIAHYYNCPITASCSCLCILLPVWRLISSVYSTLHLLTGTRLLLFLSICASELLPGFVDCLCMLLLFERCVGCITCGGFCASGCRSKPPLLLTCVGRQVTDSAGHNSNAAGLDPPSHAQLDWSLQAALPCDVQLTW